ncbi:MAG: tetratricopeptide repeat protein [Pseudomonadota bacterium]
MQSCFSSRLAAVSVAVVAVTGGLSPAAFARSEANPALVHSRLGGYLAARIAQANNDTTTAAKYYNRVLALEPGNRRLVLYTFLMEAADGNFDNAVARARQLERKSGRRQLSNLWIGVDAFRNKNFAEAERAFRASGSDSVARLVSRLALAWTELARGRSRAALRSLTEADRSEWAEFFAAYRFYASYHRALIADHAGLNQLAIRNFKSVIAKNQRAVRAPLAYARSRAVRGDRPGALAILRGYVERTGGAGHPLVTSLSSEIESGRKVTRLVLTPQDGLAEVFYGVGAAIVAQNNKDLLGAMFLQIALELRETSPMTIAALGGLYEQQKRYRRANALYERMPLSSALHDTVQLRKALNLNQLDLVDEARTVLLDKVARRPDSLESWETLANIMRSRKRYEEAVEYYSKAIALLKFDDARHWSLWYGRGASYERIKKWPLAEKDLLKAKSLNPNEPFILNYLGYSWVDQDVNLKEGLELIKKAVSMKPKDGYITDSLGWAYFKLGDYDRAVVHLEKAVQLLPEDPILNDHLGDALWQVGRVREARFQWSLALTLKPEPGDAVKIKSKLARGLTPKPISRAADASRTGDAAASATPSVR